MAISWNNVAAPDLGESNSLFTQAIQSLKDAGAGLKDTAKDYQTVVRNKSHAILQDYINSARTPEELQSEAFNTGFKNLQATLANEYDAVKVNEYKDSRGDLLTKRASDAVALKRNQFGLDQEQLAAKMRTNTAQLYALRDKPLEQAALAAKFAADNALDHEALQKIQLGDLNLKIGQDTVNLNSKTFDARAKKPALDNESTAQGTAASKAGVLYQAGMLGVAQKNAESERIRANAEAIRKAAEGSGFTAVQGEEATQKAIANVRTIGADALKGVKDKFKYKDMKEVDDAILADETWSWAGLPKTAKLAKEMINNTPEFTALPNPVKAAMYMGLVTKIREDNILGKDDWFQLNRDKYFAGMLASAREHTGYIENAKAQEKVAIQDFAVTVNRMSGKAPDDAFGFKYANSQLGVSALTDYGVSQETLDKLNKGEIKQPPAPTSIKQNRAPEVQALNEKYLKTKDLGEKLKLMHQMTALQQQYEVGTSSGLSTTPQSTAPAVTPVAKQVQESVYVKSPLDIVSEAVTKRPTPLLPAEHQNAFKSKANNLSIDLGTGKTAPAKNPVAIPDVTWGKPVQAVTLDPILAKLPQHRAVITYAPDGDTAYGTSSNYTTAGQPQGKIRCRVDSINTPETPHKAGQPTQTYGAEAAKIFQDMVLNKEVSIRITKPTDGSSNYGRDVCQIEVAGKDVSVELLRAGAAWLYTNYNHYGTSGIALQDEAKAAGKGLWAYPNPINPETFSHNNR